MLSSVSEYHGGMSETNKVISYEAVEAAAKAMSALGEADNGESEWPDFARLALEAAAPHIAAQAWDEGWFAEGWQTNPYRSQA